MGNRFLDFVKNGVNRLWDTSSSKFIVKSDSNVLNLYLTSIGEELESVNLFGTFNKFNIYGDLWYFNLYSLEHYFNNGNSIVAKGTLQLTAGDNTEYTPFFLHATGETITVNIGSYRVNQSTLFLVEY